MFATLYSKTFTILSVQLLITWLSAVLFIRYVRKQSKLGADYVTVKKNQKGELEDLEIKKGVSQPFFHKVMVAFILLFLLLLFNKMYLHGNAVVGIVVFTLWSISSGVAIALALISVDENLGWRVLALTVLITSVCMFYGLQPTVDFSSWRWFLHLFLYFLIIFGIIRNIYKIPRAIQRVAASFGVLTFTGYLLFDFNRLQRKAKYIEANTWSSALDMAISLYLDVINLFLDLLDLLSN